jgi:hypothetical protein
LAVGRWDPLTTGTIGRAVGRAAGAVVGFEGLVTLAADFAAGLGSALGAGLGACLPVGLAAGRGAGLVRGLTGRRTDLGADFTTCFPRESALTRSSLLRESQPRTPLRRAMSASSFFVRSVSEPAVLIGRATPSRSGGGCGTVTMASVRVGNASRNPSGEMRSFQPGKPAATKPSRPLYQADQSLAETTCRITALRRILKTAQTSCPHKTSVCTSTEITNDGHERSCPFGGCLADSPRASGVAAD